MYDGGRSDLFYNIMLEDGNLTTVNPWPINTTNYTLTGLMPYTIYYVFVVAENGVSSFADRILSRAVQVNFRTSAAGVCYMYVLCMYHFIQCVHNYMVLLGINGLLTHSLFSVYII